MFFSLVKVVVDKPICEQHRVVCVLNFLNGQIDALFEILFSLNTIANLLAQLLEVGRVNEEEICFDTLLVDFEGSGGIHLDNWNLACSVDPNQFLLACAIKVALNLLVFDEVLIIDFLHCQSLLTYLLELFL